MRGHLVPPRAAAGGTARTRCSSIPTIEGAAPGRAGAAVVPAGDRRAFRCSGCTPTCRAGRGRQPSCATRWTGSCSLYRYVRTTPGHPLHEAAAGRDLAGFYDWTLNQAGPRRQTVGIQCRFCRASRPSRPPAPRVDAQYDLIAPIERLQDFANACARLVGRPVVAVGARNVTAADAQDRGGPGGHRRQA
ncbi:MAG: hypothetical protein WDM92_06125 [Caulobacteraceae bacterium]